MAASEVERGILIALAFSSVIYAVDVALGKRIRHRAPLIAVLLGHLVDGMRAARDAEIRRRVAAGDPVTTIAAAMDLTGRRVRQIARGEMAARCAAVRQRNAEILQRLRAGSSVSTFDGHKRRGRPNEPERNRRIAAAIRGGTKPLAVAAAAWIWPSVAGSVTHRPRRDSTRPRSGSR